jgi:uncharacterized protein YjiS (DUF1127 family)
MKWVTRERQKIARVTYPGLIRRLTEPDPLLLFVPSDRRVTMSKGYDTGFRPRIAGPVVSRNPLGRRIARGLARSLDHWWEWGERARQRRALRELPDYLLRDIGVSRDEAELEAHKPFWRA